MPEEVNTPKEKAIESILREFASAYPKHKPAEGEAKLYVQMLFDIPIAGPGFSVQY
jgi:hypothetical protein